MEKSDDSWTLQRSDKSFCHYFSEVFGQSITRREAAFVVCVTEVCRPGLMVTCEDTEEEAAGGAILMSFGWTTGNTEQG